MSEAKQLYDDILCALSPLLPRTVYQDVRRVRTLAWAVTGLCLRRTVRLSAWAEVAHSRSQHAARRVRRFSRWLHHPAIVPSHWYRPVVLSALSDWPVDQRLYVALDTTALLPFVLIRASLVYRGRAIPLAWRVMRHQSTTVAFEDYYPVLEQVRAILPAGGVITLRGSSWLCPPATAALSARPALAFSPPTDEQNAGSPRCPPVHGCRKTPLPPCWTEPLLPCLVSLFAGAASTPVSLALTRLPDRANDPWLLASSEPANTSTFDEYSLRFDIEESFRDEQSGGFQLQTSHLATPDALERLLLCISLATLYLTSFGTWIVQAQKRHWIDPYWWRGLSYLQLGWRGLRLAVPDEEPAFVPFRLDPTPDPLPVPASRRLARSSAHEQELPTAA